MIKDWNDQEIEVAYSKGGVPILANPLDNLISTNIVPWPTSEVIQKHDKNNFSYSDDNNKEIATKKLGYNCYLQSINSEDAITWSVFGTVSYHDLSIQTRWVNDFFNFLELNDSSPNHPEIFLWKRFPHAETLVPGGSEIDFGILTEDTILFGEAKWNSPLDTKQGKKEDKDQIQIRAEFLQKYINKISPNIKYRIVLYLRRSGEEYGSVDYAPDVLIKSCTWDDVCDLKSHPLSDEVKRYLEWKKQFSAGTGKYD